jgi:hypothetical protein
VLLLQQLQTEQTQHLNNSKLQQVTNEAGNTYSTLLPFEVFVTQTFDLSFLNSHNILIGMFKYMPF